MRNLTIILALVLLSTVSGYMAALAITGLVALLNFVQWERKTYTSAATNQRTIKKAYKYA